MPTKKHKPEEIIGKLREVEIMLGQGGTTAEACRRIAVSEQTYCPPDHRLDAATAFAGAVLLILLRVISADQAYGGLRPEILILIAGMVVIGIAMEESGLAAAATNSLIGSLDGISPLVALIILYALTMVLTELLSNATVAVLVTPVAVALAESLGVSARPFIVAVMMAGSAAFATPFGYQTNVIVYQMGGYGYMDFVRVGLPLNLITFAVAIAAIRTFFPF